MRLFSFKRSQLTWFLWISFLKLCPTVCRTLPLKRIYSSYQSKEFLQNIHRNKKSPVNFNQHIAPFSNCLLQVMNFEGVDFLEPPVAPLILSRLEPSFERSQGGFLHRILPVEKLARVRNGTVRWIDTLMPNDIDNTFKTRSLTCEVHAYMYPPSLKNAKSPTGLPQEMLLRQRSVTLGHFYLKIGGFKVFAHTVFNVKFWTMTHPCCTIYSPLITSFNNRWRYDVLIADAEFDGKVEWAAGIYYYGVRLEQLPTATSELLHWKTTRGSIFEVTVICNDCQDHLSERTPLGEVQVPKGVALSLEALHKFLYQVHSDESKQLWLLEEKLAAFRAKGRFRAGADLFYNHPFTVERRQVSERLLHYALGNASYKSEFARNGRYLKFTLWEIATRPKMGFNQFAVNQPQQFPTHQTKLLFIACGHREMKGSSGYFVLSYDIASWCTIVFFEVVGVALVVSGIIVGKEYLLRPADGAGLKSLFWKLFQRHLVAGFKNMLGQGYFAAGDRKFVRKHFSVRIIIAVVTLMAVVLCQVFKGGNMKKILNHVPSIPYSTLQELVNSSYTIYSQVMCISEQRQDETTHPNASYEELQACTDCNTARGSHCFPWRQHVKGKSAWENWKRSQTKLVLRSEINNLYRSTLWGEFFWDGEFATCDPVQDLSPAQMYVLNNTKMMDTSLPFEEWRHMGESKGARIPNCPKLATLKKIAFLVNEDTLVESKKMYNKNFSNYANSPISFGTEVVGSAVTGYVWYGRVPAKAIFKMKALYSSGVMEYHELNNKSYYESAGMLDDFPRRSNVVPGLSVFGGLQIAFLLFPVGILLSFISCSVERAKRISLKLNYFAVCRCSPKTDTSSQSQVWENAEE